MPIDWNHKSKVTPEEEEYNRLCREYEKRFGVTFGYTIGNCPQTIEQAIAEVQECLRTGKPQKIEPWDKEKYNDIVV